MAAGIPARLRPLHRAWMTLARAQARVTTPVLLGVVYFAVIAPIGLVLRAFGFDPLRRSPRPRSRWHVREPGQRRSDLTRQF